MKDNHKNYNALKQGAWQWHDSPTTVGEEDIKMIHHRRRHRPIAAAAIFQLLPLLLLQLPTSEPSFAVGVGIGIGGNIGSASGGGGSIWVGPGSGSGGNNGPQTPPPLEAAYNALQVWKSSVTEDPLGIFRTWTGFDVCSYRGVFCSEAPGGNVAVTGIDLNRANLRGTLAKELSLLSDLALVHLNSNRFTGPVPASFRDLVNLQELDLSNNDFSGAFPRVTLYMPSLVYLDLRFNNFSGAIPPELFDRGLDAILLNNNRFAGELPGNLVNSPASVINLANNRLSGSIPFGFGLTSAPKLREILLLNNQLTGCVPEGIGLFSSVEVVDVSYNSLVGHLPDTLSCLGQIEVLNFGHNRLSGVVPETLCSLRSLLNLTVAFNFLSGIGDQCSKLFFRNIGFDFSSNCIPERGSQRPGPDCSVIPGGSLSCLRLPNPAPPIVCGVLSALSNTIGDVSVTIVGDDDGGPMSP